MLQHVNGHPAPVPPSRYSTSREQRLLPKVEVYVDEYGDRGFTTKSSEVFAMTGVVVPEEHIDDVKIVVGGLKNVINTTRSLHWVEHFTPKPQHLRRRTLASRLVAQLPGVKVIYVVADKSSLIASQALRADRDLFYNYTAKLLLERVAFQAKEWPGGPRLAIARLSSVRGMHHEESVAYLEAARQKERTHAPFEYIQWPPRWDDPRRFDGLQLADLYTGMLGAALSGSADDRTCAQYLLEHRHQLRRSTHGKILGYGIKVFGAERYLTSRAWWGDLIA